jgi:hypothetical protein
LVSAQSASRELSASEHRNFLTRAVIAATIGASIEWYDFFL